jgi:hypothetical protein
MLSYKHIRIRSIVAIPATLCCGINASSTQCSRIYRNVKEYIGQGDTREEHIISIIYKRQIGLPQTDLKESLDRAPEERLSECTLLGILDLNWS